MKKIIKEKSRTNIYESDTDYVYLTVKSKRRGTHTFIISPDKYESVSEHQWSVYKNNGSGKYYAISKIEDKFITLHRFILDEDQEYKKVVHRDGNSYNNTNDNLISGDYLDVRMIQNGTRRDKKNSDFKNVYKVGDRFYGRFMYNRKYFSTPKYDNQEDANIEVQKLKKRIIQGVYL